MEEKKYLKWYNKIGYGSGDIAGNVVYAFLTSFMMVYLTDSVGLAAGVVGTLIAVSKLFDGFTDIFFSLFLSDCSVYPDFTLQSDYPSLFTSYMKLYYPFTYGISVNWNRNNTSSNRY